MDWTDAANWTGPPSPPVAGDDLRFPAGALRLSNNNDFPAGTPFNRLTYAGAGYTASGNEIQLAGGIVVSHGAGNTILNLPIDVGASQTFLVSVAGANLFLNGSIELGRSRSLLTFDGAGQTIVAGNIAGSGLLIGGEAIRKNGPGILYILSHLTLDGSTTVNGGALRVDGSLSNSPVTLNAGATLLGTGKVGGLTANSGGIVSPGATDPDSIEVLGDLTLAAGSTLNIRLNGTTAGINYDQLRVQGGVTLGGTLNVTAAFIPAVGERFTLIENDGTDAVVGTFADLPEGAVLTINGRPFQISYGARLGGAGGRDVNDVMLEAVPALAVWDGGGGLNKFWSEPLNWVGDAVPLPGDDVQFATASWATLTTINDFPPARLFGSLIFGAGSHGVGGNLASFTGNIQVTESKSVNISMPMMLAGGFRLTQPGTLILSNAVTLSADQKFWVDHTNASATIGGPLDLGGHNLAFRTPLVLSQGTEYPAIIIEGSLSGSGTITKEGAGTLGLYYEGAILGPGPLVIQEGTFTASYGTEVFSPIRVSSGATLRAFPNARLGDVEVQGGTFAPERATADGAVRMLAGSIFSVNIGSNAVAVGKAGIEHANAVELAGCTLDLRVEPNTPLEPGQTLQLIGLAPGNPPAVAGSFNGLPEGTRFVADGHVWTLTYQGGSLGKDVVLTVEDKRFAWDGGGSGNLWGTAANWEDDLAPLPDAALFFPANVPKPGLINDYPAGTRLRSLTFLGPSYVLVGNSFLLTEGLYSDVAAGDTVITTDLTTFAPDGFFFTCRVSNASRLVLEGSFTSYKTWKKTGAGTLRLTGSLPNNQVEGGMAVQEGELELAKPAGVDAISDQLLIGDGTNAARVTLFNDEQIADSTGVSVFKPARLDLNGHQETVWWLGGDGTVSLDGRFVPGQTGRLTVGVGEFAGTIVGEGGLTKAGPDSFGLSGTNTYSGLTIVSEGTLVVDGVQTNSPIQLDGGILTGRGQVGTITGNSGGVVQPGWAGAVFQNRLRSRDVAFNATTTFRPLLTSGDPGFENSQLQVTGTVNLGGSTLSVDLLGTFKPANNDTFLILENDGSDPIVGTFAGLPEGALFGSDGLPFRISYVGGSGNDVVLNRVDPPPPAQISQIGFSAPGAIQIHGHGGSNLSYTVLANTNLATTNWQHLGPAPADALGRFLFQDTNAGAFPQRFYRLRWP